MFEQIEAWPVEQGADQAQALFAAEFGAAPAGVWSAPGRVNIIGEHLDYNGGACLPIALPHATYVAISPRDDHQVRIISQSAELLRWHGQLDDIVPGGEQPLWVSYVLGSAWVLAEQGHRLRGLDAALVSCVPDGAGLSSSAAVECSMALALHDLHGLNLSRAELASICQRSENTVAGAPTGSMDQSASLMADAAALFLDTSDGSSEQVPFTVAEQGYTVLVIDTQAKHALVDGQYAARREVCDRVASRLGVRTLLEEPDLATVVESLDGVEFKRVRHVATEQQRVCEAVRLLREGAVAQLGPILNASHASLRDDYEVSSEELDVATDAARMAGALGARMTGGGFGGSAIALVRTQDVENVMAAVAQAYAQHGWTPPRFLRVVAGPAARRVR